MAYFKGRLLLVLGEFFFGGGLLKDTVSIPHAARLGSGVSLVV